MRAYVYLFVCELLRSWFCGVVMAQVSSLCRANERLLSCGGCQKSCWDPAPQCDGACRVGCYCPDDLVRGVDGKCVKLADCPVTLPPRVTDTTEPRPRDSICPPNEEYRFCEPCHPTCDNPNPICPAQCARGCFCRAGLVRNREGRCVSLLQCRIGDTNHTQLYAKTPPLAGKLVLGLMAAPPTPEPVYQLTCDDTQVFKECGSCEKTCSNPAPRCPHSCMRGCFCKRGLVKAPSGKCIPLAMCPRAEISPGAAHEPSVDDCGWDEVFLACGWCEPTCSEPHPRCKRRVCIRGCLCRPPLLRHRSGRCVEPSNCVAHICPSPLERYTCLYDCEARCDGRGCARGLHCRLGCHCRAGLRRSPSGDCVRPKDCPRPKDVIME